MSILRGALLLGLASGMLLAADTGIRPRPSASDYPAQRTLNGITVAAAVLSPDQVRSRFATDLNKAYLVVEVAFYPESGHDLQVASRDFMLRVSSDPATERPASSDTIAAKLGPKEDREPPKIPGKVHVYEGATIGYEHGPYGRSGVYTGTSVGVGVGGPEPMPGPAPAPGGRMDRASIRQELDSGALPDGRIKEETAGYLYFPKPNAKGKNISYELTYYGQDGQVKLTIPAVK